MEKKKQTLPTGRQVVMSGIRPTGFLHLGNYFGALRNYVRMQEEYECYFMVADLHSLTTHPDTKELADKLFNSLSAGGTVILPLDTAPWGAYFGMFIDKFGIKWLINHQLQ